MDYLFLFAMVWVAGMLFTAGDAVARAKAERRELGFFQAFKNSWLFPAYWYRKLTNK
jgi:hypothetical protein